LTKENGVLVQKNYHSFTGESPPSSDGYFYVDALEHLLKYTEELDGLNKLYIVGDHGPHFCSKEAFYFESNIYNNSVKWRAQRNVSFGLEVHCHFLCSYHAYNRCDGVGAVIKRAAARSALPGGVAGWPRTAEQYVSMINTNKVSVQGKGVGTHIGVYFASINRLESQWPKFKGGRNSNNSKNLREICEVKYTYPKGRLSAVNFDDERMEGVLLCRKVSNTGLFRVVDLLPSSSTSRGACCADCSDKLQRPVHHALNDTVCEDFLGARTIPQPQSERMLGGQQIQKRKKKTGVGQSNKLTVDQLKQLITKFGLTYTVSMRKAALVAVLEKNGFNLDNTQSLIASLLGNDSAPSSPSSSPSSSSSSSSSPSSSSSSSFSPSSPSASSSSSSSSSSSASSSSSPLSDSSSMRVRTRTRKRALSKSFNSDKSEESEKSSSESSSSDDDDDSDANEFTDIEKILAFRTVRGEEQWLVKWKNDDVEYDFSTKALILSYVDPRRKTATQKRMIEFKNK
jgi:hypothetical protein